MRAWQVRICAGGACAGVYMHRWCMHRWCMRRWCMQVRACAGAFRDARMSMYVHAHYIRVHLSPSQVWIRIPRACILIRYHRISVCIIVEDGGTKE